MLLKVFIKQITEKVPQYSQFIKKTQIISCNFLRLTDIWGMI